MVAATTHPRERVRRPGRPARAYGARGARPRPGLSPSPSLLSEPPLRLPAGKEGGRGGRGAGGRARARPRPLSVPQAHPRWVGPLGRGAGAPPPFACPGRGAWPPGAGRGREQVAPRRATEGSGSRPLFFSNFSFFLFPRYRGGRPGGPCTGRSRRPAAGVDLAAAPFPPPPRFPATGGGRPGGPPQAEPRGRACSRGRPGLPSPPAPAATG